MAAHVQIAQAFRGDSLGGNTKKVFARKPGRGGRKGPRPLASLGEPGLLEDFLLHDPDGRRISVLLRWSEYKDSYLRGEKLEPVITEIERALVSGGDDVDTISMLEQLLELAHQALEEDLVLGIIAD